MASIINATTTNGVAISADNSGILQLATNSGTTAVTIDTSQNVGIGTASPTQKLDVTSEVCFRSDLVGNPSNAGAMGIYGGGSYITGAGIVLYGSSHATNPNIMTFNNGSYTERARIDASGSTFFNCSASPTANGTSSGGLNSLVTGGDVFNIKHTANGNTMFNLWQTGTSAFTAISFCKGSTQISVGNIVCTTTATIYNTVSDYRLKENVLPMVGALDVITQLKPVTYDWISNKSKGQGFIAHELQAVVPDCVTGEKDAVDAEGNPQYQGIDTSFLVATLTSAIQELKVIIDQQATRISALESKIV